MRPGVLPQVILPVEALAALVTNLRLLPRVYHKVQVEVLFPLEALRAHGADEGSFRIVAEFVAFQVLLALEAGAAYVAYEAPLDLVADQVLFEEFFFGIGHVALGAAEESRAVQGRCYVNLKSIFS